LVSLIVSGLNASRKKRLIIKKILSKDEEKPFQTAFFDWYKTDFVEIRLFAASLKVTSQSGASAALTQFFSLTNYSNFSTLCFNMLTSFPLEAL